MRLLITAAVVVGLIMLCGSSRAGAEMPDAEVAAAPVKEGWAYETYKEYEGTKSEGQRGRLTLNGDEVPAKLRHLLTPIGEFTYVTGEYDWDFQGWMKAEAEGPAVKKLKDRKPLKQNACYHVPAKRWVTVKEYPGYIKKLK